MKGNKTRQRNGAVILLIFFAFLIAGCWNRHELRELGLVGMIGLEKADGGVKVTLELIKPERRGGAKAGEKAGAGGGKKPVACIQAEGETLFDALRNATLKTDRKFFVAHNRMFIFSEDIARQGLAGQLDFIARDHEFRIHVPMVIAVDASPAEIMGIAAGVEKVPSKYVHSVAVGGQNSAKAVLIRVIDFMQMYREKGKHAVVGVIRKGQKIKITSKGAEYELDNEGAAVFKKDKLVGFLDGEEARGYNWVTGNVKAAVFISQVTDREQRTAMEIFPAESKLDVEMGGGSVKIKVKADVPATVIEETGALAVNDPAVVAMLEASTAEVIKREIVRALKKAQEYRSDVFGFGQVVHRKYPGEWKNIRDEWDELFAGAENEIMVEVTLMRTGKASGPAKE